MRSLARYVLTAALCVAAVGSAQAQRPGGGGGGPGGGGQGGMNVRSLIVTSKPLQEELKVTEAQVTKFKELAEKQSEAMKGVVAFGGDEEEQIAAMEVRLKLMKERVAFIKATLSAEQQKRLGQIEKQTLGSGAFTNAKVAKELAITEEQTEKIKTINTDMQKDMRELFQGGFDADAQKKMATLRTETSEKIVKVLTDDQQKKWKDMTGETFDTAKLFQRPMRMNN